mmetsp:Transcript_432/g.603  ORF Transcript_432/g.603 Transcript_432/m.603 type:complete len:161 (+) Transcript_432:129-611(+)
MLVLTREPIISIFKKRFYEDTNNRNCPQRSPSSVSVEEPKVKPQHMNILPHFPHLHYALTVFTSMMSIAWETIAFAWYTQLISPEQYNQYQYRKYQHITNSQINLVPNLFDSRGAKLAKTMRERKNDESWGQFVDVDYISEERSPTSLRKRKSKNTCFIR